LEDGPALPGHPVKSALACDADLEDAAALPGHPGKSGWVQTLSVRLSQTGE
jgi:hypothetical protein